MRCLRADDVPELVAKGASARIDVAVAPKFRPGQQVRVRNLNPVGHTRLPRYVRGRIGTIQRDHGVFGFPDAIALGRWPAPQHVYLVRFEAEELWGSGSRAGVTLVDLWDDYLEPFDVQA